MPIVSQTRPFVIGVDCHARTHTYAIMEASTKRQVACEQFPTTLAGISRALAWVGRRTDGDMGCLWAVEGIGSYGARLAKAVADAGYDVAEAPPMNARGRRGLGKSDPLDATAIGTAVLGLEESQLRVPRRDEGTRACLRILSTARDQLTRERTMNVNALIALSGPMTLESTPVNRWSPPRSPRSPDGGNGRSRWNWRSRARKQFGWRVAFLK
ncbi:hypothetical protein SRABI83_01081 [Arthrobacter sp. Bi83]|nr:hypothetical protein SRABI83_01081 [Arthrobacter sp. Bi83]